MVFVTVLMLLVLVTTQQLKVDFGHQQQQQIALLVTPSTLDQTVTFHVLAHHQSIPLYLAVTVVNVLSSHHLLHQLVVVKQDIVEVTVVNLVVLACCVQLADGVQDAPTTVLHTRLMNSSSSLFVVGMVNVVMANSVLVCALVTQDSAVRTALKPVLPTMGKFVMVITELVTSIL